MEILTIDRDALLKPLQMIANVVDSKQALPVLSCLLLSIDEKKQTLTVMGTNLEAELVTTIPLSGTGSDAELAIPARKLHDICRALPEKAEIKLTRKDNQIFLRSGRSRFVLSLLPSNEFPTIEKAKKPEFSFTVPQAVLKRLFDKTHFSMAHQDVRYFLNGLLLDVAGDVCTAVTTDGHRLSTSTANLGEKISDRQHVLIPRRAVLELSKLLDANGDQTIDVEVGANYIALSTGALMFTSKLIDGRFPEYKPLIPSPAKATHVALINKPAWKEALSRVAILSNEKFRGAWLIFEQNKLTMQANNPDQDEVEETMEIEYSGDAIKLGCNVNYLLDVLNVIESDQVKVSLSDANSSVLIEQPENSDMQFVVMPMCL